MELTDESKSYHVENSTDTLKLVGQATIKAGGLISLNGQVSTVASPFKSLSFSYNEESANSINRSCNGASDIQTDAGALIDATVAAIREKGEAV